MLHRVCRNMSMDELARQLGMGYGLDGQVVNETGLAGSWDLGFDFAPVRPAGLGPAELPANTDGPTIFQSMNQLGLTLQPGKRALPVIVIDRAEKPGEN